MSSDIAAIKQKVEGDTANKNDIAMLRQQMSEMVAAQEERVKDETQAHNNLLESVSSGIGELKRKLDGEAAKKENICILDQKIDDLKIALEERDDGETQKYTKILESVSSDTEELRRNVGGDTATKDDIVMLQQTIENSLKADHEKRNTHSKTQVTVHLRQFNIQAGQKLATARFRGTQRDLEWLLIET